MVQLTNRNINAKSDVIEHLKKTDEYNIYVHNMVVVNITPIIY
jgi:hypothetical protein